MLNFNTCKNMKILLNPDPPAGGNGNPPDWTATLPDDLKGFVADKGFKAPVDLAKSYKELNSLVGQKRVLQPDANWKDEQWQEFYKSIGRPETADKYELPKDFKFPDGMELAPDKFKAWQERFHKHGLLPRQADALMRDYLTEEAANYSNALKSIETQNAEAMGQLKEKWGDKYDANVDMVKAVIRKFGDADTMAELDKLEPGKVPGVFRFLQKIGSAISEDSARGNSNNQLVLGGPAQALAEIDSLKMDKDFMAKYWAGEKPAVERWNMLFEKAYPSEKKAAVGV